MLLVLKGRHCPFSCLYPTLGKHEIFIFEGEAPRPRPLAPTIMVLTNIVLPSLIGQNLLASSGSFQMKDSTSTLGTFEPRTPFDGDTWHRWCAKETREAVLDGESTLRTLQREHQLQ